jgi:hypothetical protein
MVRSTREQNLSAKISCQERAISLFFSCYWQENRKSEPVNLVNFVHLKRNDQHLIRI